MKNIKALILVFLAFTMVACGGAEERKAAYMEKAQKSLDAGDLDKARIELKNVLQIDPKDAQAYFKLGNIFERKKEFRKAFGNYNKAAELDPDSSEYQAKIGRFYLVLAGDIEKATEKMDLILSKDKNDINGLLLKAGILVKQEKVSDAKEISRNIFEDHPGNVDNAIFLASLYSQDKEYTDAIAVLDKSIKLNSGNQTLLKTLANTLFVNKEFARSEQLWKEILNAHPEVFQNHLTLTLFYQKTGESAKAEDVLRAAIAADEEDVQRKLVLIEFIKQVKGTGQAISELESIIKNNPSEGSLRLALAGLQIAEKDIDGAASTYRDAVKDFSDDETGITSRVQLAKIYMQKEDVQSAISIIDEAAEIAPNDPEVNLVKAKIALVNKNMEQAIISLRTVIKDNPESIEAYFLLARAHAANDEKSQAEEIIARAHENNRDNIKALLPLAKYHVQNKNSSEAEKVIDDYLRLDTDNYDALSIKSAILNSKKNYSEAYDLAEKMVNLYPEKENGYIQSIAPMLDKGKVDELKTLLNDGYAKTGKNIKLLQTLVAIDSGQKKYDSAINRVNMELAEDGENAELHRILAKVYDASGDKDQSQFEFKTALSLNPELSDLYLELANLYTRINEIDKAISILQEGKLKAPNIKINFALAQIYEKNKKYEEAINEYENILVENSDNLMATNNLAALLSDHRQDKQSIDRALELAVKLEKVNQPVILDTVGWVYYKAGDYVNAVRVMESVVSKAPNIQVFDYHLGMAYQKSGNNSEAKKYLEAALTSDKDFPGRAEAEATLKSL